VEKKSKTNMVGRRGGRKRHSSPGVRDETLGGDETLVLDVRISVCHELHHTALGAEILDSPGKEDRRLALVVK
jgi:hypothetical protein